MKSAFGVEHTISKGLKDAFGGAKKMKRLHDAKKAGVRPSSVGLGGKHKPSDYLPKIGGKPAPGRHAK